MKQSVIFKDLGTMGYKSAWDYQEYLLQMNVKLKAEIRSRQALPLTSTLVTEGFNSKVPKVIDVVGQGISQPVNSKKQVKSETDTLEPGTKNYLLFVEHPPVFTLGKNGNINNVLMSEERLRQMGIEFFRTNRGGDITFHGPRQIVGYPILDLERFDTDIGHYLRNLEEVIILTLDQYGIQAGRSQGETGVWIAPGIKGKERKICAIGVRCSRWITMHGFAFNVNTDLHYFNLIIPCGIQNKQVTSLKKELGTEVDFEEAKEKVKRNFERVFDVNLVSS